MCGISSHKPFLITDKVNTYLSSSSPIRPGGRDQPFANEVPLNFSAASGWTAFGLEEAWASSLSMWVVCEEKGSIEGIWRNVNEDLSHLWISLMSCLTWLPSYSQYEETRSLMAWLSVSRWCWRIRSLAIYGNARTSRGWGCCRTQHSSPVIRYVFSILVVRLTYLQSQERSARDQNEELDGSRFLELFFFVRDITSLLSFYILSSFG